MKTRIRELAEQCYEYDDERLGLHLNKEKFAELIVEECIAQVNLDNTNGNNQWDRALTYASDKIKQHFGVQ